ncbi:cupin domain-containing protein [bacterium]|nr:MAG: cupin domain-containing protein [bacterium]
MAGPAGTKSIERRPATKPDETRTFTKGKIEVTNLGGTSIGLATFEPGWRWSECVKPLVGTRSCQVRHLGYVLSGRMEIVMDDGTKQEFAPGDLMFVAPGHDAVVVGDETCRIIDWLGAESYAKK